MKSTQSPPAHLRLKNQEVAYSGLSAAGPAAVRNPAPDCTLRSEAVESDATQSAVPNERDIISSERSFVRPCGSMAQLIERYCSRPTDPEVRAHLALALMMTGTVIHAGRAWTYSVE